MTPEEIKRRNLEILEKSKPVPMPIAIRSTEPAKLNEEVSITELISESFVVELDESHIVSSAIN